MKNPPPPAVINRPYGLCKFEPTREQTSTLDSQLRAVVDLHVQTLSPNIPLREQMQALARSVYMQGILDAGDFYREGKGVV